MAAAKPCIGIDFDNTIVSYDTLFHRLALEQKLIPPDLPPNKSRIRDHLRACGQEPAWTAIQGLAYGPRITEATPFPGVDDFFAACATQGVTVYIVSHKTKTPIVGDPHDLHAAAMTWLARQPFFKTLPHGHVFFEPTKQAKLARIQTIACSHFIDDLPELLSDPSFPTHVVRILFDPGLNFKTMPGIKTTGSWLEIQKMFGL